MVTSDPNPKAPEETVSSQGAAPDTKANKWKGLQKRVATSILMVAIALPFIWYGGWPLTIALIVLAFQMNREWENLIPENCNLWRIVGIFYVTVPVLSFIILRNLEFMDSTNTAFYVSLFPIIVVSTTDIAAYFGGKYFRGPKLAPNLSPKKTWSGLLSGVACASVAAVCMLPLVPWPQTVIEAALLGASIAVLAQSGDLFESSLKRRYDVKDSSSLLPGHGGVLDRLDGYIFVLPGYLALIMLQAELLP